MRRIRIGVVLVAFLLWAAVCPVRGSNASPGGSPASSPAASQPASRPGASATAPATRSTEDVGHLRKEAFERLLRGDFTGGARILEVARSLGNDRTVAKACALMAEYIKIRNSSLAEQQAEQAAARKRVRLAKLAEEYRPRLIEAQLSGKIWEHVKAIAEAVNGADKFLQIGSATQPAEAIKDVLAFLDRAAGELASADALVVDQEQGWAAEYHASVRNLAGALALYRQAWQQSSDDGHGLAEASGRVQDALIDVSVLVSRQPLMSALNYARQVKELAGDPKDFLSRAWVKALMEQARKQGDELIDQGKWLDALLIYGAGGLAGLDEDNVEYEQTVKRIAMHVRVLTLYSNAHEDGSDSGQSAGSTGSRQAGDGKASTRPAEAEEEPEWREMIVGVDTAMVRAAIEKIAEQYVSEPDFRDLGIGGLGAVRVLVESSQAAETFATLKDDTKRQAFLDGIDRQIKYLRRIETVDYLHVIQTLYRILNVNAETVNLPPEVINMEFAEGMLGELDRFTSMIWPYEEENFDKYTTGSFYGIGVQIQKQPGEPIEVITPLTDTPALRAGIQAGDRIIRVGGAETRTMDIRLAVKRITGRKGTKVTLTIRRSGRSEPFDLSIVRAEIHIQTVKGWRRLPEGNWDYFLDPDERIGYIRLTQFTRDTVGELRRALRALKNPKDGGGPARGLILDLRSNPGGLLSAAGKVADEFLRRGLIVSTKTRDETISKISANLLGGYQRGLVVVLVNKRSASASEIVAGALKDWGRALIVGERTFGKGSVQRPMPLRGKRARLKLTTAYYYLPKGRCLHRRNGDTVWGVDPDIPVKVTLRQMNRWAKIRRKTDLLKDFDADRLSRLLSKQLREDIQLQTALLIVRLELLSKAA